MTGKELYDEWCDHLAFLGGCSQGAWSFLSPTERKAWERTAADVQTIVDDSVAAAGSEIDSTQVPF